jgi:hypothetical protein
VSFLANGLSKELFVRVRSLSRHGLESFAEAGCASRRAAMSPISDGFTNALLGRGRALKLDLTQSLPNAGCICLRVAMFVDRSMNEVLMCRCSRVVLKVGSRNRAVENDGWRNRVVENVRCGPMRRALLNARSPGDIVGLCNTFLCGRLFDICAVAVSASVDIPIKTKARGLIISRC